MLFRRLLAFAFALLLLLIAVGAVAFTRTWDSPELGRNILDRVGAAIGARIEAETFRLSLRDGLRLGNVHIEADVPTGRLTLDAESMLLEHQLGPLLRRQIHVDRVRIERPRVVLQEVATAPEEASDPAAESTSKAPMPGDLATGFSALVTEIALVDATLESRPADPTALPTVIEGLDLTLDGIALDDSRALMTSLRGTGAVRVRAIDAAGTRLENAQGALRIAEGTLQVEDLRFDVAGGGAMQVPRFALQFDAPDLPFDVELRGALDVEGLLGISERWVGGDDLVFEGTGPLVDIASLAGAGRVEVREGRLPAAKLFRLIDGVLGDSVLVGAKHQLFNVVYRLQHQTVKLDAFEIGTDNVAMTISGEASLDGTIQMLLELRVPRAMIKIAEIPEEALDVLEDEHGRVRLPFQIGGDYTDPKVVLARKAVLQAARQGAKREVKARAQEEVGNALRRFLAKRNGRDG